LELIADGHPKNSEPCHLEPRRKIFPTGFQDPVWKDLSLGLKMTKLALRYLDFSDVLKAYPSK
jgi:hypothetical protein